MYNNILLFCITTSDPTKEHIDYESLQLIIQHLVAGKLSVTTSNGTDSSHLSSKPAIVLLSLGNTLAFGTLSFGIILS
jgi:hypothetical protein